MPSTGIAQLTGASHTSASSCSALSFGGRSSSRKSAIRSLFSRTCRGRLQDGDLMPFPCPYFTEEESTIVEERGGQLEGVAK
eukprot:10676515-Heterocapsa_arctica.AAC.1